jgi:hypothetical protein
MKNKWIGIGLLVVLALPAFAQKKEEERVEHSGTVMKEILNAPDSIPQSVLDKAYCVAVLPSVKKFAIGIGGSYGKGVMTCRGGKDFNGKWGAPTMINPSALTLHPCLTTSIVCRVLRNSRRSQSVCFYVKRTCLYEASSRCVPTFMCRGGISCD